MVTSNENNIVVEATTTSVLQGNMIFSSVTKHSYESFMEMEIF